MKIKRDLTELLRKISSTQFGNSSALDAFTASDILSATIGMTGVLAVAAPPSAGKTVLATAIHDARVAWLGANESMNSLDSINQLHEPSKSGIAHGVLPCHALRNSVIKQRIMSSRDTRTSLVRSAIWLLREVAKPLQLGEGMSSSAFSALNDHLTGTDVGRRFSSSIRAATDSLYDLLDGNLGVIALDLASMDPNSDLVREVLTILSSALPGISLLEDVSVSQLDLLDRLYEIIDDFGRANSSPDSNQAAAYQSMIDDMNNYQEGIWHSRSFQPAVTKLSRYLSEVIRQLPDGGHRDAIMYKLLSHGGSLLDIVVGDDGCCDDLADFMSKFSDYLSVICSEPAIRNEFYVSSTSSSMYERLTTSKEATEFVSALAAALIENGCNLIGEEDDPDRSAALYDVFNVLENNSELFELFSSLVSPFTPFDFAEASANSYNGGFQVKLKDVGYLCTKQCANVTIRNEADDVSSAVFVTYGKDETTSQLSIPGLGFSRSVTGWATDLATSFSWVAAVRLSSVGAAYGEPSDYSTTEEQGFQSHIGQHLQSDNLLLTDIGGYAVYEWRDNRSKPAGRADTLASQFDDSVKLTAFTNTTITLTPRWWDNAMGNVQIRYKCVGTEFSSLTTTNEGYSSASSASLRSTLVETLLSSWNRHETTN